MSDASVERKMEVSSGVSEKGSSGNVGMDAGPLTMGTGVVAMTVTAALFSVLISWLCYRRMYII